MKAWQTPMLTSPSANSAGSQTTRFIDLSFLPAQPSKAVRKQPANSFAGTRNAAYAVICGAAAARRFAYVWARRYRRDPDKGYIPIAMRVYKAAIKNACGDKG